MRKSEIARTPVLVVFSGIPGTGKTTLSRQLAEQAGMVYLRADTIQSAQLRAGLEYSHDLDMSSYAVAEAIARDNLSAGLSVIIDAVNADESSRQMWRELAASVGVDLKFVEVVCSDEKEHRRRVEDRSADMVGQVMPSWKDVQVFISRYAAWHDERITVDTATSSNDFLKQIRENCSTKKTSTSS